MIGPFLVFGFLLGVKHALEADHVAAVAALATRSASLAGSLRLAALWGLGHGGVVVAVGAIVLAFGLTLPESTTHVFEGAVGVMLIALGADVLRRLRRERVHLHAHRHDDGTLHLHAHAHRAADAHPERTPRHEHGHRLPPRALVVGGVHGLAGSAALVLLAAQEAPSAAGALLCLGFFGVGATLGMLFFSLAISLPLRLSEERAGRLSLGLEGALGTATIALGFWILKGTLLLFSP